MFRHVVMVKWKPEATLEQRAAAAAGLRSLPGIVPQIRRFTVGENAGVDAGTFDLVIVADFDSAEDYMAYRDHPDHRALIANVTGPIIATRAAIQHVLE